MVRTSLLLVTLCIGVLGCGKTTRPEAKNRSKDAPIIRPVEKAAKPSPYKPKAPRQVSVVNRPVVPSAAKDAPQSE